MDLWKHQIMISVLVAALSSRVTYLCTSLVFLEQTVSARTSRLPTYLSLYSSAVSARVVCTMWCAWVTLLKVSQTSKLGRRQTCSSNMAELFLDHSFTSFSLSEYYISFHKIRLVSTYPCLALALLSQQSLQPYLVAHWSGSSSTTSIDSFTNVAWNLTTGSTHSFRASMSYRCIIKTKSIVEVVQSQDLDHRGAGREENALSRIDGGGGMIVRKE